MSVVTSFSSDLAAAFDGVDVIALDVEGVDLSRDGVISIVQISTPKQCFLLDMLGKPKDDPLVNWLRSVLESYSVLKIIHDCRMDSDALYHLLNIRLVNVHDTAVWHRVITGDADQGLNTVLTSNKLQPNVVRDSSVYRDHHDFWAKRLELVASCLFPVA